MQLEEARPFARRLFSAHGRQATDVIVDEYAATIVEATCEPCAIVIFERARTTGRLSEDGSGTRRLPTAPELREAIARMGASVAHGNHLGRSSKVEEASRLETFWRTSATKLIRPHAGNADLARLIGAQMWWAGVHPSLNAVTAEIDAGGFGEIWVETAEFFAEARAKRGTAIRALIDVAFERARNAHVHGEEDLAGSLVDLEVPA
jgi:hypothetical protein